MAPFGSLWLPLAPSGSLWLPLACLRIPVAPSSTWSTGLPWALCVPCGSLWPAYRLPTDFAGLFGKLEYVAPSWLPLAPLWLPLAPSGSLWLLTDSIGPFKQLECMVPFRYLWPTTTTHATGVVVPRKLSPIFNFGVGELLAPLSSGSLWLSLPPFGSLVRGSFWLPLAPSGSLWLPLACLRIPLDSWSSWSTWLPLAPFGSLVAPSASLWLPLACLRIPVEPWNTLEQLQYVATFGSLWFPCVSLWLPLAPSGLPADSLRFLEQLEYVAPFGFLWLPGRSLWLPMGSSGLPADSRGLL